MKLLFSLALSVVLSAAAATQVPMTAAIQALKAEDARRYDSTIEGLMKSPNADVRKRAALAAGRIGDAAAIPVLADLLDDRSVASTAAFALGEIEAIKGADAILAVLEVRPGCDNCSSVHAAPVMNPTLRARLVEAAGKIAAANPKDPKSRELGSAILDVLNTEYTRAKTQDTPTVLLALTAALRAKPDGTDVVVAKFLTNYDARVRADAANTLARLKAKVANKTLYTMVSKDSDPIARANAARALGAAEDKGAVEILVNAATKDLDPRVRVSAIRAVGNIKDPRAANRLLAYGKGLLGNYAPQKTANRREKSEALEIATALSRLLERSDDADAITFLTELAKWGGYRDPEPFVTLAHVSPNGMIDFNLPAGVGYREWRVASAYSQGMGEIGALKDETLSMSAGKQLSEFINGMTERVPTNRRGEMLKAMPDLTRALAALKPGNMNEFLRGQLANDDVFIRVAAAELIGEQPLDSENVEALKKAFDRALLTDKHENDAQLAILDALYKVDKKASVGTLLIALSSPDHLVRNKAFDLLADNDLQKHFPGVPTSLEYARAKHKDHVLPYTAAFGTKLGQVLNTDADYRRALSRKDGTVKALLTTEKGTFTIDFFPEEAPLTVDNFIKLARSGYFNGVEVHRVVPNFVMQDGDPRGDGNGGPGWSIRCEINMLPYDRGAVGMALSGKDTGGSQWFVTHSPQPHLDGGYTVFGHVNEMDMKVVDNIVRGDKIITVKILGR